jgi:hypothetical protein
MGVCGVLLLQVHNPSESHAIKENLKDSQEKLKDAHQPL